MSVCKVEWFTEKLPEIILQEGGRKRRAMRMKNFSLESHQSSVRREVLKNKVKQVKIKLNVAQKIFLKEEM